MVAPTSACSEYREAFGNDLDVDFGAVLDRFLAAGLLCETEGRITMSEVGRSVYDLVTLAFYPEDARRWLLERQEASAPRALPQNHGPMGGRTRPETGFR